MSRREERIHRLPLTGGFDVEIKLPRDLTALEATRVCQLVQALVYVADDEKREEGT